MDSDDRLELSFRVTRQKCRLMLVGRRAVSAGVVLFAALAFMIVLAVMPTGLYQDNNHSQMKCIKPQA
ncbi:unnamed protein product [Anisakis simplex]|uniref:Col_cuticle_N domain-containing protein n=1 Tax=Anisakis simplex TaxID=6269 RepID=A0A0M3JIV1_ANISI|nr:unnamed protein product [Anisakis simplex]